MATIMKYVRDDTDTKLLYILSVPKLYCKCVANNINFNSTHTTWMPPSCKHTRTAGIEVFFDPQKIVLETSSFWGRVDLVPSCPGTDLTWDRFGFGDEVTVIPLVGTNRSVKDRFRKSGSIAERGSTELAMDCSGLKQINKL